MLTGHWWGMDTGAAQHPGCSRPLELHVPVLCCHTAASTLLWSGQKGYQHSDINILRHSMCKCLGSARLKELRGTWQPCSTRMTPGSSLNPLKGHAFGFVDAGSMHTRAGGCNGAPLHPHHCGPLALHQVVASLLLWSCGKKLETPAQMAQSQSMQHQGSPLTHQATLMRDLVSCSVPMQGPYRRGLGGVGAA